MCGLAGFFHLSGAPADPLWLRPMLQAIAHRGPDGEGYWNEGACALAHKRLAILDTSDRALQPMISGNKEWVLVFNGCIYDFRERKKELEKQGICFRTTSDTEVLLEGIAREGLRYVEKVNGMFALAAWHRPSGTLYLARDRFGVKPLYYWFDGNTIVFASEIKGILKYPDFPLAINFNALSEYFTFQNLFTYQTLFKDVYLLPQANTISITPSTREIVHNSWWDFNFTNFDEGLSFEEAREGTLFYFKQAVQRQMVSDVPVGAYLSGGMDSGSIVSVAAQYLPRLATFTCGFDMSAVTGVEANFDERRDAELMASYFKTEHYEQVINSGDLGWSLPRVVYHLEDLRLGMSYPNFYIARLASKFVKVCLQGTGGDELFGGYPWRYYRIFHATSQNDFFEKYYGFWQRLVPDEEKDSLFQETVKNEVQGLSPREIFERVFKFNPTLRYDSPEQHIANSLYFEIKTFLHGLLLLGDKLSMAHGLEERFPFLDNDLVAFAQKIPPRHKLGNLQEEIERFDENNLEKYDTYREFHDGKNVLRRAMASLIPETIINRKKQGFSSPEENWYRGENANYVRKILLEDKLVSEEFIRKDYIARIVREHTEQQINHRLLIWSFLCFEWWCRIFLNNETPA
ncbi:MAG: asparagine synthase (glutamine-hydrolyzing) [Flavobacteriales bacterium]|nr:asparagine synthase (glutamine-hydrolyzing) [Flavobacteriales bacterium]MCX7649412.1 asparagine synthase (glutamine-hydrolyzing) [Flavobacteriales bacterium]MDW8433132.1 asparagine synthase (glutamine-hydrolyzing) [Flavobacteriales bacterium]